MSGIASHVKDLAPTLTSAPFQHIAFEITPVFITRTTNSPSVCHDTQVARINVDFDPDPMASYFKLQERYQIHHSKMLESKLQCFKMDEKLKKITKKRKLVDDQTTTCLTKVSKEVKTAQNTSRLGSNQQKQDLHNKGERRKIT